MKAFNKVHKEAGFSLVELMIVVGIIGLLATLAIPRFQQFQAKAKMAEAKTTLSHIYTLQEAYHLDNNVYRTFAQVGLNGASCTNNDSLALGLEISPCDATKKLPRFGYQSNNTANGFFAVATSGAAANNMVCPGKGVISFGINQARLLSGGTEGSNPPNACP